MKYSETFIETRFLEETWFLLYLTISENAIINLKKPVLEGMTAHKNGIHPTENLSFWQT
jgi:hypothetical protein